MCGLFKTGARDSYDFESSILFVDGVVSISILCGNVSDTLPILHATTVGLLMIRFYVP